MRGVIVGGLIVLVAGGCRSRPRPVYEYEPPITIVRPGRPASAPATGTTAAAPEPTPAPAPASPPTTVPRRSPWLHGEAR